MAALTVAIPFGAGAAPNSSGHHDETYVSPQLLDKADTSPGKKVHVIVQSDAGTDDAAAKLRGVGGFVRKELGLIDGVAVDVPAGRLHELSKVPGLTITPDAPVKLSDTDLSSKYLWPFVSGNAQLWDSSALSSNPVTIAIVDSGVDRNRADFGYGSRVLPQVTLTSLTPNSPGDGRGHGTFVASIAAGSARGYAGAAPKSRILPIDVMDDSGRALTSDVIAACNYILANKNALNIRVANFSLHSAAMNNFYNDPLDRAVEKLWFNGVFVAAAAGNYGSATGPSGVTHAPGNDPFVMTVGAVDIGTSYLRADDTPAPWTAWGRTEDGFSKPELGAPGRYMVGAVPTGATLTTERPDHVVAPGYMVLSGTSFAAPVVAGTAAEIIARHPSWTPDQVKGVLMLSAAPIASASHGELGVGELNSVRAAAVSNAPNPNSGLDAFVKSDSSGGKVFDAASWSDALHAGAFSTASWGDASWADASWATASWGDLSFSLASWADASWADASWADASWGDSSAEDAVEGEPFRTVPTVSSILP